MFLLYIFKVHFLVQIGTLLTQENGEEGERSFVLTKKRYRFEMHLYLKVYLKVYQTLLGKFCQICEVYVSIYYKLFFFCQEILCGLSAFFCNNFAPFFQDLDHSF